MALNIMMPEMSGHEVVRELRSIERNKGIGWANIAKVLMVTALDDAKNIMQALVERRREACLTKPVS